MSLINEALKKAQRMRQAEPGSEGAPAADDAAHAPRVPKRRPAVQARNVVIATGCVVLAFAVAGGIAFYYLLPDTTPPEIVHRAAPKAATPAPVEADLENVPTVTVPTSLASPEEAPSDSAPAATPDATAAPASQPAETTPPPPPEPQPVENPRVYEFLDTLRVAGIRASATDPKVLMNERVFRLNDIVDRSLGLRITGISPDGLTFTDETGFEYRKNF